MSEVVVIDYGMGNLRSISNALRTLGAEVRVSEQPEQVRRAGRLVLPGVGAFGRATVELRERGLEGPIREAVAAGTPLVGICLGFQLLFEASTEHGENTGFGWVHGRVERFEGEALIVPHMGWNRIVFDAGHPLLRGVQSGAHVYFVHSYRPVDVGATDAGAAEALARTDYDGWFVSAVAAGNVAGFQFHPEKSGRVGLRLLANFLSWAP